MRIISSLSLCMQGAVNSSSLSVLSEAPFRRTDSEDRPKISREHCWDTTLQLKLDSPLSSPQKVPSVLNGQPSAVEAALDADQCMPASAQSGKSVRLSSFEILMRDLETKEANAVTKQFTTVSVEGRHRDWMNFVTLGENEQNCDVELEKKSEEQQKFESQYDIKVEEGSTSNGKQQKVEQKEHQEVIKAEQKCEIELDHLVSSPSAVVSLSADNYVVTLAFHNYLFLHHIVQVRHINHGLVKQSSLEELVDEGDLFMRTHYSSHTSFSRHKNVK